jgi:hypothetical protein
LKTFGRNAAELFVPYFVVGLATGGMLAVAQFLSPLAVPHTSPTSAFFGLKFPISLRDLQLFFLLEFVVLVSTNVFQAFLIGGVALFGVRRFRGEEVSFGDALMAGLRRFPQILVGSLIVGLITAGLLLVPFYPLVVGIGLHDPLLALVGIAGLVVGLPIAIYLGVALALYAPIVMLENLDAIGSLRRSWELTRGRRGPIFGAQFLLGLLAGVVGVPIALVARFVNNLSGTVAAEAIISGIVGSWSVLVSAVAYDLIVRPRTPYYPQPLWPTYGPPASAAWGPPAPPRAPPSSPPPG